MEFCFTLLYYYFYCSKGLEYFGPWFFFFPFHNALTLLRPCLLYFHAALHSSGFKPKLAVK